MNSTAETRRPLAALSIGLALAVSALAGGKDASRDARPDLPPLHRALNLLQSGQARRAEQIALPGTKQPDPGRAWLVVASARQQAGRFDQAAAAWAAHLQAEPDGSFAEHARRQLQLCRDSSRSPFRQAQRPSRQLTAQQRKALAVVDDRVHVETSERFVVRARNARLAKLMVDQAEKSLDRICNEILNGVEFNHSVDVYVWTDRKEYLENASDSPDWSGGSYTIQPTRDGELSRRIDLTQCDESGKLNLKMLDRILPHELAHVVLRDVFGDSRCPLVIHEGLAMLAEYQIDNERIRLAGTALAGRKRIGLTDLLAVQWPDVKNPDLFYAEAFSLVEFVYTRLTRSQRRQLLKHMKAGSTFTDALQRVLCVAQDEAFTQRLERAWEEHAVAQAQFLKALDESIGVRR
jgi:hypothetical protein